MTKDELLDPDSVALLDDSEVSVAEDDETALEYSLLSWAFAEELDSGSVDGMLESDEVMSAGLELSSELLDACVSASSAGSVAELLSDEQAARNAAATIAERGADIPLRIGLILGSFGRNSRDHAHGGAGRFH